MNEKLMYYFNYKLIGSMNVCWLESVTMVGVFLDYDSQIRCDSSLN